MVYKSVLFGAILLFIFPYAGFAQDFSIDTMRIYADIEPGKNIEHFITATFTSQDINNVNNVKIKVGLGDWVYDDVERKVKTLPPNTQPNSCVSWIKITPVSYTHLTLPTN